MFASDRRTPAVLALLAAAVFAGTPALAPAGNENPALRDWVAQLLQEHPRVLAGQANADAAQAQGRAAQAPLHNPELELGGGARSRKHFQRRCKSNTRLE